MLFGVGCNYKFYAIIDCLLPHARLLIFRCETEKSIRNISKYYLVDENAKKVEKRIAQKYYKLDAFSNVM